MSTRTNTERARDEARVEAALFGRLVTAGKVGRTLHTKVVGVTHNNPDGSSRQAAIEKMTQFDLVELVRDPDDQYDSNAIEVFATIDEPRLYRHADTNSSAPAQRRVQIGHLDRDLAGELAPLIDSGERWSAIATRVGGHISRGVSLMLFRIDPYRPDSGESWAEFLALNLQPATAYCGSHKAAMTLLGREWRTTHHTVHE